MYFVHLRENMISHSKDFKSNFINLILKMNAILIEKCTCYTYIAIEITTFFTPNPPTPKFLKQLDGGGKICHNHVQSNLSVGSFKLPI